MGGNGSQTVSPSQSRPPHFMASTRRHDDLLSAEERPAKRARPSVEPSEPESNALVKEGELDLAADEEGELDEEVAAVDDGPQKQSDLYLDTVRTSRIWKLGLSAVVNEMLGSRSIGKSSTSTSRRSARSR